MDTSKLELGLKRLGNFLEENNKSVATSCTAIGSISGVVYASGMTKVVLSSTAVPNAIASKAVIVNGIPMVLSKVTASLFTKVVIGSLVAVLVTVATYGAVQYIIEESKKL